MTTIENGRPTRPLSTETLRAMAEARGLSVDDALLEELRPMVADMFDLADGIERWLERQEDVAAAASTSGGQA